MIRYCIFDLSGTIADKYSLIPYLSIKNTFQKHKIIIPKINYLDLPYHNLIENILNEKTIKNQWLMKKSRSIDNIDKNNIYNTFIEEKTRLFHNHFQLIPHTRALFQFLKKNNIKIIIQSNYHESYIELINKIFLYQGINIDYFIQNHISTDKTIDNIIKKYNINNKNELLFINDTINKLPNNYNNILVSRYSYYMNVNSFEKSNLLDYVINHNSDINENYYDFQNKKYHTINKLLLQNPNHLVDTLSDIIPILKDYNNIKI
tara:strand:+ start:23 stop:808 length:786 start_codon:yes stop_codon:yes gene_type:complete